MGFSAVNDIIWNLTHYFSALHSEQTESVPCACSDKHLSGYLHTCMFLSSYFSLIVIIFLFFFSFVVCLCFCLVQYVSPLSFH